MAAELANCTNHTQTHRFLLLAAVVTLPELCNRPLLMLGQHLPTSSCPWGKGELGEKSLAPPSPHHSRPEGRFNASASHTSIPTAQNKLRKSRRRNRLRTSRGECRQVGSLCARSRAGLAPRITPYLVGAMRHPCQGRSRGRRGTLFLKRSWGTASKSRLFLTQSNIRSLRRMTWSWANHRRVNSQ